MPHRSSIGVLILALVCGFAAQGHTTHPFTLAELADGAAQVIDGEIAELRSYYTESPRRIETEITLTSARDLKNPGALADGRFTLIVPGGTVGDTTMRLCCAPDLALGQRWVLFVQPTYKTYPTVAMGQGMFGVVADSAGVRRIVASGGAPVTGISVEGLAVTEANETTVSASDRTSPIRARVEADRSVAGVRPVGIRRLAPPTVDDALTLDDFLESLAPILRASDRHDLAEPAGRPLRPELGARALVAREGLDPLGEPKRRAVGEGVAE